MLGLLINNAYAMAGQTGGGAPGAQGGGGVAGLFIPMIVVFAIFYFLMIRPQQKQAKKVKAMLEAVKKGDEVVTRFGVHGTVYGMADNIITLEVADNIRFKMNKDQIAFVKNSTVGQ